MNMTNEYGTWRLADPTSVSVENTVRRALTGYLGDIDIDGVCADWRDAINEALPEWLSLHGDDFYATDSAQPVMGYPQTEDGKLDIAALVEEVDFWGIVARHDVSED